MAKVNPLLAGLQCRCPNCGEAPLFRGYLRVYDRCEGCGTDLSRADSGDGPVVFILLIVGAIGCFGILFMQIALNPPIWVDIVVWLPLMGAMTLALLRPFKATMSAFKFHNRASEARNDDERNP